MQSSTASFILYGELNFVPRCPVVPQRLRQMTDKNIPGHDSFSFCCPVSKFQPLRRSFFESVRPTLPGCRWHLDSKYIHEPPACFRLLSLAFACFRLVLSSCLPDILLLFLFLLRDCDVDLTRAACASLVGSLGIFLLLNRSIYTV